MSVTLKRRLEQLEETYWRTTADAVDRYLEGRSIVDIEFFCVNGYLPENPILGPIFKPPRMSWPERWREWKESQRVFITKTTEEREYFCIHGQWPAPGGCANEDKSEESSHFEESSRETRETNDTGTDPKMCANGCERRF
jgi:hypothetical protein